MSWIPAIVLGGIIVLIAYCVVDQIIDAKEEDYNDNLHDDDKPY